MGMKVYQMKLTSRLGLIPDMAWIGVILGLYWGYIGIMEKKKETTIMGLYGV